MTVYTQLDKVFVRDNGKTYCISFEQCENWLSSKGILPPFSQNQRENAAEQIVCETGDKYLVKKES